MSNDRLVETLTADCRAKLIRSLEVRIATRVGLPGEEPYPPGAVDYGVKIWTTWYAEEAEESDMRVLGSISPDSQPDDEQIRFLVGEAHVVMVDLLSPELFDALDAREADLAYLGELLFPPGSTDDGYEVEEELASPYSDALLVNSVTIDPRWRGMKLGLLATGIVLGELGRGCSFAALDAMQPGTSGEKERQSVHKRLTWYWRQLGFSSWRGRVMVLDLGSNELRDSMTQLLHSATSADD